LTAADVQRFAEGYVATSVLAKRFRLDRGSLARYLKESGTPLLAIPIPDVGKEQAFFLRKEVAAQIQIASRRMLREAALRRIVASRRKKWVEYRQSKETAWVDPCDGNAGESSGSLPLLASAPRDGTSCN
jgi:hypothetical protein